MQDVTPFTLHVTESCIPVAALFQDFRNKTHQSSSVIILVLSVESSGTGQNKSYSATPRTRNPSGTKQRLATEPAHDVAVSVEPKRHALHRSQDASKGIQKGGEGGRAGVRLQFSVCAWTTIMATIRLTKRASKRTPCFRPSLSKRCREGGESIFALVTSCDA